MKYFNKCELLKNAIRFGPPLVPFQYLLDSVFGLVYLLTWGTIVIPVVTFSELT
jgi:hypothetical protein